MNFILPIKFKMEYEQPDIEPFKHLSDNERSGLAGKLSEEANEIMIRLKSSSEDRFVGDKAVLWHRLSGYVQSYEDWKQSSMYYGEDSYIELIAHLQHNINLSKDKLKK